MVAAADGGTSSPCHLRLGPAPRPDSPPPSARRSPRPDSASPPTMATAADGGTSSPCHLRLGPAPRPDSPPLPARRSPRPDSSPPPARSPRADSPPPQIAAADAAPPAVAVFDQSPSHIEMIKQYLLPFVTDATRPPFIHTGAEVYADGVGPEQLSAAYEPALASDGKKSWMFFTHVVPQPGGRMKRKIPGLGTWQGERGNIKVKDAVTNVLLGHRRTLSFVATGSKSRFGWIMEEYALHPAAQDENLVLCRVYRSTRTRACTGASSSSSSGPSAPPRAPPPRSKRSRAAMGSDTANHAQPKRSRGDQPAAPNADDGDFSIKRCVLEMKNLDMSDSDKAAAFDVFKNRDNREIFLCSMEGNPEAAVIWLRKALAKMVSCEGLPFRSYPASSAGHDDVYGPEEHFEKHHSRPNTHDKRSPDNNYDAQESRTIAIAQEYIGVVIGRAGRNINDIMQATGAWIKASARGDFVAGTTDRKVMIKGTQEAINAAEAMIRDLVSVASRRKGSNKKKPVKPDTTPQEVEQQ